jgi:2-polyprenyl-3-methyl-5-hydroxy-6-metoxy-1,4-benzoquinol methylase
MRQAVVTESLEGQSSDARLNRYRVFDEVNAPYLHWQIEQVEPFMGARLLEVGCGVGGILSQLTPREFVMGIDIEKEEIDFARTRFRDSAGFEFALMDIAGLSPEQRAALKARRFDTVLCVNVLEHIKDDAGAVTAMTDVLVPGGVVAILVPAHPALYGYYDEMDGHFRRYTKSGLRSVLLAAGLDVERLYRFNAVGAAGWFVQYRLLRRKIHRQGHFKVMQAVMPAMKAIESRVKPPVGLSLVAIARKPKAQPLISGDGDV